MRILFISDNFPPEVNAPASRTYEHTKEWVKAGNRVTVITCAPNFPNGKVYKGYKNRLYQKELIDGIEVIRVWSYIAPNRGFLKRVIDYFSFAVSSFFAGLFIECDLIVATSPQFFTTWSAWALSKIKRKPWVFELRDIWPESIKSVGVMKHKFLIDSLEKIELALYRDSAKVIAVTDSFKSNLIKRGIEPKKIEVITNGANLELFKPRAKSKGLLRELNLEDKFIVGYIGTHGLAHGLDFILNSISKIDSSNLHFLFIGDGAKKRELIELANRLNLKNITFLEPIPKSKVPEYLSIIDVSLIPLKKSDTFKSVIPSKIFEASAMLKPILLGVEGEAKEIVESYRAGLTFEPENERDFLEKLRLIQDENLYNTLKEGCRVLARDYSRRALAKKMLNILYEIS